MGRDGLAPGAAGLHLVGGLSLLRPEEQVFTAMLDGWRNQQLARNLAFSTINGREKLYGLAAGVRPAWIKTAPPWYDLQGGPGPVGTGLLYRQSPQPPPHRVVDLERFAMTAAYPRPRVDLLCAYLCSHVTSAGVAHDPCRSRVLESVLAHGLLHRSGAYPDALARVEGYLKIARQRDDLNPVDQALLGSAEDPLAGFDHHTATRKQVLMNTVRYLAGTREQPPDPLPASAAAGAHAWKQVELLACRVIRHHATGQEVTEAELGSLARHVGGDRIVEDIRLIHLLCLHALAPYPAHHVAFDNGLALVVATQCQDGGFSFIDNMDIWVTSVVGTALGEAGAEPEVLTRIGDWLAAQQSADGGWGFAPGIAQTDLDDTYMVLATLHHQPERYAESLAAGHRYLRRMQNQDGGWSTYLRGNPSEPAMTGGAITILAERHAEHAEAISAGAQWLAQSQQPDGTFERDWSPAEGNPIFRAVQGLCAARDNLALPAAIASTVQRAIEGATDYLSTTQNPDGGWGQRADLPSDATSTSYALAALGRTGLRDPIPAALRYLAVRQRPDGGFGGPADTTGPRPVPIDAPLLVPAQVLRGLAFSAESTPGTRP